MLLRDDKSYPYIYLSSNDKHPRLAVHRGAKHAKGEYFGPFPNAYAVRETLALMQKLFPVRQCEDSVYRNRSRPCLQYQIGRCLGPCVKGLVSDEDYDREVNLVRLFLEGKDQQVLTELVEKWSWPVRHCVLKRLPGCGIRFRLSGLSLKNSLLPVPEMTWMSWVFILMPVWPVFMSCLSATAACRGAAVTSRKSRRY